MILADRRGDPEEILTNLGFAGSPSKSKLEGRIPERFLRNPSCASGINIEEFLDDHPELREYLELQDTMSSSATSGQLKNIKFMNVAEMNAFLLDLELPQSLLTAMYQSVLSMGVTIENENKPLLNPILKQSDKLNVIQEVSGSLTKNLEVIEKTVAVKTNETDIYDKLSKKNYIKRKGAQKYSSENLRTEPEISFKENRAQMSHKNASSKGVIENICGSASKKFCLPLAQKNNLGQITYFNKSEFQLSLKEGSCDLCLLLKSESFACGPSLPKCCWRHHGKDSSSQPHNKYPLTVTESWV